MSGFDFKALSCRFKCLFSFSRLETEVHSCGFIIPTHLSLSLALFVRERLLVSKLSLLNARTCLCLKQSEKIEKGKRKLALSLIGFRRLYVSVWLTYMTNQIVFKHFDR